ncbi:hypothetical protein SAMN06265365_12332 [Tistlia consotensis]|uniref:Uncharacterized protein n=1 Tax=Tistlia consotensis USBA 355 TaxID=560819 RepID=A0A1Y6CPX6_9PROT|nr:hypothetical protein [Tistlia consotensis]SMF64667.1 hypothetical protein SAMN05428998_12577 [Tistlia consotensis USBA 355]SNR97025.1 hypothetical protein SAMN06265365_12332 [Tistlia consotensis]
MIFDKQCLLSDDQRVTTTAVSDVLDLGARGTPHGGAAPLARDVGTSAVPIAVLVTEDFTGPTSLQVAVEVDDDAGFGAPATLVSSRAVPVAELKAGFVFNLDRLPRGSDRRYLRLQYLMVGSGSTGRLTAGIVAGLQQNP